MTCVADLMVQIFVTVGKFEDTEKYRKYYEQFVKAVVPGISRSTLNFLVVRRALAHLWPEYIKPIKAGEKHQPTKLLSFIRPMLQSVISDMEIDTRMTKKRVQGDCLVAEKKEQPQMVLEIPYMSKFLLLAAYLASRNAPTTDRAIFDPGYTKRRRKNSQALDRQTEQALAGKLRGTHSFPLERVIQIYYYICEHHNAVEEDNESGMDEHSWLFKMQQVDVFMQISSLVALGLLSTSGRDPLDGSMYRCNISDDMAYQIAQNLKFQLNDYLKLA